MLSQKSKPSPLIFCVCAMYEIRRRIGVCASLQNVETTPVVAASTFSLQQVSASLSAHVHSMLAYMLPSATDCNLLTCCLLRYATTARE